MIETKVTMTIKVDVSIKHPLASEIIGIVKQAIEDTFDNFGLNCEVEVEEDTACHRNGK